jgi:hypothetical protein
MQSQSVLNRLTIPLLPVSQHKRVHLIEAVNPCPPSVAREESCLTTTNWTTTSAPFTYKMTIIQRRASTVFNRYNYTILDVLEPSATWNYTDYGPEDFFPIFNDTFAVNLSNPNWVSSTQYAFLNYVWTYLSGRINSTATTGADEGLSKLRSLFAVPIIEFNNVVYGGPVPDDLGKSFGLARISYRVRFPCFPL